jgi:hypothetical protein
MHEVTGKGVTYKQLTGKEERPSGRDAVSADDLPP